MNVPRFLSRLGDYGELARDALVYVVAGTLVRSVSVVVVPVLTRTLSVASFGVIETLTALQLSVCAFAGMNLDTALVRYYYESRDAGGRRTLVTTIMAATLVTCLASALAVAAAAQALSSWFFQTAAFASPILMIAASVPPMTLGNVALTVLRLERRSTAFAVVGFIAGLAQGALVAGTAWFSHGSITAIAGAQLAGASIFAVLAITSVRSSLVFAFSWPALRRAAAFSLPLFPSVLISWYLSWANRFFLVSMASPAATGVFAAASKIHIVVVALTQAFLNAAKPYIMSQANEPRSPRVLARLMMAAAVALAVGTVVTAATAQGILRVYAGPAYGQAGMTAAMLVLSTCLSFGIAGYYALRLELAERTAYMSLAQGGTFLVTTALNLWLIPLAGSEGAAAAVIGGSLAQAVLLRIIAGRLHEPALPAWTWSVPAAAGLILVLARVLGLL
jgi:O-antigen/teichoic acid export membrane protein